MVILDIPTRLTLVWKLVGCVFRLKHWSVYVDVQQSLKTNKEFLTGQRSSLTNRCAQVVCPQMLCFQVAWVENCFFLLKWCAIVHSIGAQVVCSQVVFFQSDGLRRQASSCISDLLSLCQVNQYRHRQAATQGTKPLLSRHIVFSDVCRKNN